MSIPFGIGPSLPASAISLYLSIAVADLVERLPQFAAPGFAAHCERASGTAMDVSTMQNRERDNQLHQRHAARGVSASTCDSSCTPCIYCTLTTSGGGVFDGIGCPVDAVSDNAGNRYRRIAASHA